MNRREDPRDPAERRTRPVPRQPQRPPAQPQRPAPPPPRRPAQPPGQQPWYLEFRRPPAQPPRVPSPARPPRQPAPGSRPPIPPTSTSPSPSPRSSPKKAEPQQPSNRMLLTAAAVTGTLVLAVLVTLVLRGVADSGPVELDVGHAQDGVWRVLTDPINGYGRDDVTDVRCNNGVNPRVRKGSSFTCTVIVNGVQRRVLAEFADDAGTYEVDRPR
ncbi:MULTISPECIES: DUF4333 domain-containing protein [Mycobacteriaceae]|nr:MULTISPECIES: DUF4333 domain-containing protein [Mycobacteriaceae]